jgi:HK97 family phage prohead protease
MLLEFELDVLAADVRERTIEGLVAPYGEAAPIKGQLYRFAAGSLTARARTPLLVDHDRSAPVGVLAELVDGPAGALGRFRVDETAEGDRALIQAASGSRGSLSVGALVVDAAPVDDAGVIEVRAGSVVEVSLVSIGAFESAQVTRVAAELDEPDDDDEPAPAPDDEPDAPAPADPEPAVPDETEVAAMSEPSMILAARDRDPAPLGAGELVQLIVRAQHGEPDARRMIEAALVRRRISTDVSGLLPPQYERTVIGGKPTRRPLYNAFRSRPLPGVGLAVNKPKWTTRPDGAWAANVDADATTSKVVIGAQAANVERWDWAGAIPWVVVQRSDPSIIDEIYSEAVEDFYLDVETRIAAKLTARRRTRRRRSAPRSPRSTRRPAARPGNHRSSRPTYGASSPTESDRDPPPPAASRLAGGRPLGTFGGLPIVASPALGRRRSHPRDPPRRRRAVTEPVRLTANAIGALNVELAVVGEGLFDVDYPNELMALTAPVGGAASSSPTQKAR